MADYDRSGRGTWTLAELAEASGVPARTMPIPRRSIVGARIPMRGRSAGHGATPPFNHIAKRTRL